MRTVDFEKLSKLVCDIPEAQNRKGPRPVQIQSCESEMGSLQVHLAILLLVATSLFCSSSHILAASLPRSLPVNLHPEEVLAAGILGKKRFNDILQMFSSVSEQGREQVNTVEVDLASGTYSYTIDLGPSH